MSKEPDPTTTFRVRCDECQHRWIAAYVPMLLDRFVRVLKGLRCPKCGGASRKIFWDLDPPARARLARERAPSTAKKGKS
jgi:DNA-directed RNA polymerase subunit RPC12/RpoP